MYIMNDEQRIKLNEMIQQNNTENNTEKIRKLKHSNLIRQDVVKIQNIKRKTKTNNFKKLDSECIKECFFLFTNYTNIYNKLLKNEINLNILYKFLDCLKNIEDGKTDQHEASFEIGTLLKQIYIDKKINHPQEEKKTPKKISWAEFKNKKLNKEV